MLVTSGPGPGPLCYKGIKKIDYHMRKIHINSQIYSVKFSLCHVTRDLRAEAKKEEKKKTKKKKVALSVSHSFVVRRSL
ncbi:hypothetical protein RJT34_13417 [Clitoria ternatea]|uniref:Uncharacterized protein n=1 Tax=Clitoria ternatea TaxID=43366 RepID=A0AAN9PK66_CLITE